jgi:flagellar hook-associated protein 2
LGISFGSINTGLPKDIVQQIISAERIPIAQMESRKAKYTEKQKLVDQLLGHFQDLNGELLKNNNSKSFRVLKVIGNNDVVDVTLDPNVAEPGIFRFEVDQLAQRSTALSSGFADPEKSYVGVGYIQFSLPDGSNKSVFIDSNNASLKGISNLINADKSVGMTARVINDGSHEENPYRLLIALENTGTDNEASFPYFYFVDGEDDFYLDSERKAQDAKVKIDGFDVNIPNNSSKDVIPGATVDFKKAKPGEEFSIEIKEDREEIMGKIKHIVEKINTILRFIITQNNLDAASDTSKTLGGDVTLQTIEAKIRNLIFDPVATTQGPKRISDFGIKFQRDGLLQFNEQSVSALLSKDFKFASQLMVGYVDDQRVAHQGFINKFYEFTNTAVRRPTGTLQLRKDGIKSQINQVDRQIETKERLIAKKEQNLKEKFARLESTISKIRSQGAGAAALGNGVTELG